MADGTILTICWKMGWCQAGCIATIVAGGTITGNACMIKHCGYEAAAGYMTDSTILRCYYVVNVFSYRATCTAINTDLATGREVQREGVQVGEHGLLTFPRLQVTSVEGNRLTLTGG